MFEYLTIYKLDCNGIAAIVPNLKMIEFYDQALTAVEKFLEKKGEDPEIFIYLPMVCLLKIVERDLKL